MANSNPVWHNMFRNIVLKPDNITFEAESYKDTLNIVRGPGVAWQGTADPDTALATGNDTFMINVDYDISIPVATTKLSLEDVNGNLSEVTFKAGRGVAIIRNSSSELEWESYSVTETDTLQSVTERNNITNNKIFVNNIEVGTISSSFTEDGLTYPGGYDLIGDGTLDAPMKFSPLFQDSLAANNTEQFTISAIGPGVLAYAMNYVADATLTTGYVQLEREDPSSPGSWTTIDYQSGTAAGISYFIDGTYSELYSGTVNYRLTWAWTGNTGTFTWFTNETFEGGAYTPINDPQLKTDTDAKTVQINDLIFFQNNIRTINSNTDIVLDPVGTGLVRVLGDIEAQNIFVDGNITIGDGIGTDVLTINSQFTAGTQLKTTQSNGNTLNISAYDLNDTVYRDLIILTASNTPTLVLTSNGLGSIDNMTIGGITAAAGTFTSLTATNAITANTTTNNQSYTTTGAGTITITSGTTGNINNMNIGASTRGTGAFTSLAANGDVTLGDADTDTITVGSSFVNGTILRSSKTNADTLSIAAYDLNDAVYRNLITLTASNTPTISITSNGIGTLDNITIGGTTAAAGTFTQIVRSGAVSSAAWTTTGVGIRSAANIFTDTSSAAGVIANSHINVLSQPTIAATNAITSITNASTLYIANAPTNGTNVAAITNSYALYIAAGASYFAGATTANSSLTVNGNLTVSGANAAIAISPTGVSGTITMNPAGGGSLDNFNVGSTTRGSGAFTSLGANGAVTIQTTTNNQSYTTTGAGTITITSGTAGNINNMNIGASTRGTGAFTTLDANSTVGLSPANAAVTISPTGTGSVTINPATAGSINNMAIGGSTAAAGTFTSVTANGTTNTPSIITPTTALSSTAWTTTGINLRSQARTYTDTSSLAGTVASSYIHALAAPTFASTNAITITEAANLFVAAPVAGTNSTLTGNGFSIVAGGRIRATDFTGTIGATTASAGAFTTLTGSTSILSAGTGGVGYATGAGGTGSQATAKTDTVTISKPTGQITMNAAALASATVVSFTLSNTTIAATDHVVVTHVSGGTLGAYTVTATANESSATVFVRNNTTGPLSEALVLRFSVIKSVNA